MATSFPKNRRYLIGRVTPEHLLARLASYEEVCGGLSGSFELVVRASADSWFQVDVPVTMPVWHFHNLGMWIQDTEFIDDKYAIILISEGGEERWSYWLLPAPSGAPDSVLSGESFAGRPFQVDVPTGRAVDREAWRRAPMSTRLMQLTQGVPPQLQPGGQLPSAETRVRLSLGEPARTRWALPTAP